MKEFREHLPPHPTFAKYKTLTCGLFWIKDAWGLADAKVNTIELGHLPEVSSTRELNSYCRKGDWGMSPHLERLHCKLLSALWSHSVPKENHSQVTVWCQGPFILPNSHLLPLKSGLHTYLPLPCEEGHLNPLCCRHSHSWGAHVHGNINVCCFFSS